MSQRAVDPASVRSVEIATRLVRQGHLDQAQAELRKTLQRIPDDLEANFLLGLICCQVDQLLEAVAHLEPVVDIHPNRFEAQFWLGIAKKGTDQFKSAIPNFAKAASLEPRDPSVLNELGLCYLGAADPASALKTFEKGLALQPNAPPLLHNRGHALSKLGRHSEARDSLLKAVKFAPRQLENQVQLATQFEALEDWPAMIAALKSALSHLPNQPELLLLLANAFSQNGEPEAAEKIYLQSALSEPYGLWLQERGRFEESVNILQSALRSNPVQGKAYFGLAEARTFGWLQSALEAERNKDLVEEERIYLLYSIAKAHEKEGDFSSAWIYFNRANEAAYRFHKLGSSFDPDTVRAITDRQIKRFPTDPKPLSADHDEPQPIFIVGMIRSGTTLLDQILSSHPQVGSAGEQSFWMTEANALRDKVPAEEELRARYRDILTRASGPHPRIIDKMPLNYNYLGLIRQIFPSAKILHLRRNPLDTCISIYATYFGIGPAFAYRQENIALNYGEYSRLMDHWRQILPPKTLLEVDYEILVTDREKVIRQILEFCELPWDGACMNHDAQTRSIRTPSRWQARQPVYNTSVERWKRYEPWLGSLKEVALMATGLPSNPLV